MTTASRTNKLAGNAKIVLVALFVAFHASLLIGTQTKRDPANSRTILGTVLRYYEALTGADNTFSFFAPHVAGQSFSQVIATDPDGRAHVTTYDRARTEGDIRVIAFSLAMQQQGLFDLLAYSFAANSLRHSNAATVTVKLGYYDIPKLTDKRAVPVPKVLYIGKYVRENPGS